MALWCFVLKEDLLLAWYYPRSTSGNWSCRLLLPIGPGDWSWRLVFLAKCRVSVRLNFALHTFKKQPNSTQEWTTCPIFARILIDLLYLFLTFRVGKAVESSWLTMQSIAHWMLELLKSKTKLRVLQNELWPSCTSTLVCWCKGYCHFAKQVAFLGFKDQMKGCAGVCSMLSS